MVVWGFVQVSARFRVRGAVLRHLIVALLVPGPCGARAATAEPAPRAEASIASNSPAPVRITSPRDGQLLSGAIHISASVVLASPVDHVVFFSGSDVLATDSTPPYEIDWNTQAESDGPYVLTAKARGADFTETVSPKVVITLDNTPPSVTWIAPRQDALLGGKVQLQAQASDVFGVQTVRFLIDGVLAGEATKAPYSIVWDSTVVPNVRHALQARAVDQAGNSATSDPITVKTANLNRPPVLTPIGPKTVEEGAMLTFTVGATDPDGARDPLRYEIANLPPWATFNPKTREVSGTPGYGEASVKQPRHDYPLARVEVCDPEPRCDSEDVSISVLNHNLPPVLQTGKSYVIKEKELLNIDGLVATDPDGDALTCTAERLPRWAAFDEATCSVRGTPGYEVASLADPKRAFSIILKVCDALGQCSKGAVEVTVENLNRPPSWDAQVGDQEVDERRTLSFTVSADDPDGDPLQMAATPLPAGAAFVDHKDKTGTFTWTPAPNQGGRYQMLVMVSDRNLDASQIVNIAVREISRSISGTIVAGQDKPLAGMAVALTRGGALVHETTTDEAGNYRFDDLEPGEYILRPTGKIEKAFSTTASKQTGAYDFSPKRTPVTLGSKDRLHVDFVGQLR